MPLLEEQILAAFTLRGLTVATAESCTGGLLADRLTNVAGSSAYYVGGVVSYSNDAKQTLLGVEPHALETAGAVSNVVACQMAEGVRARLKTNVGIGITGVAGPGGGTAEKPVGLVWIGLADSAGSRAERYVWDSDRAGNKRLSAEAAMRLLLAWAEAVPMVSS